MKKNTIGYFKDILESIDWIDKYILGLNFDDFSSNRMIMDAVIRNLEIIGEAAGKVSKEEQRRYEQLPWRKMIGIRNFLIHEYASVDAEIVWDTVKLRLPEIRPLIMKAIEQEEDVT